MAAFPTLARLAAQGRRAEMNETLVATTRKVLLLALAAEVLLTVSGTEIATLVYGRRRMTPEQLREIGTCLAWISIGLGAWSAQTLFARGFYALGNTWLPAVLGTAVAIAALPLYALGRTQLGAPGLAVASSIAILVYTLALALLFERTSAGASARWGEWLARAAAAMVAALFAGWSIQALLPIPGSSLLALSLRTILHGGTGALAFLAAGRLLGLREAAGLLRLRERTV
jgi:putative peptidoglycan lipid II flippase